MMATGVATMVLYPNFAVNSAPMQVELSQPLPTMEMFVQELTEAALLCLVISWSVFVCFGCS